MHSAVRGQAEWTNGIVRVSGGERQGSVKGRMILWNFVPKSQEVKDERTAGLEPRRLGVPEWILGKRS